MTDLSESKKLAEKNTNSIDVSTGNGEVKAENRKPQVVETGSLERAKDTSRGVIEANRIAEKMKNSIDVSTGNGKVRADSEATKQDFEARLQFCGRMTMLPLM